MSEKPLSKNDQPVPLSDQMRASGTGRRKVPLPPGRSQLDWMRNSQKLKPRYPRSVTIQELAQHNTKESAWMEIRGVVYDITPYIEYHPGGIPMIMSRAGKDGTKQFDKYHPWVNVEAMLSKCVVGFVDQPTEEASEKKIETEADLQSKEQKPQ